MVRPSLCYRVACTLPSKELLAEWIETYGVDSDFVRVRVRGLPPTADGLQFIDRERINEAQMHEPQSLSDEPLVCGVDVSGGGAAWNVAADPDFTGVISQKAV
jgi:hypothetical protein